MPGEVADKQAKAGPGPSETSQPQHEAPEPTPSRLDDLEKNFTQQLELHLRNIEELVVTNVQQARNKELEAINRQRARTNEDLVDRLHTASLAVVGDRDAIDKVRIQLLLDMGRDQLVQICHYQSWDHWKSSFANLEDLFCSAEEYLKTSEDVSEHWRAVGNQPSALERLLLPRKMWSHGEV